MENTEINALGFVEVRGLAAAIETADSMLKSAQVRLVRQLLRDPAHTTITVEGELGACHAAVDAGRGSATRMNAFISSQVMGRPTDDTVNFVLHLSDAGRQPFGEEPSPSSSLPTSSDLIESGVQANEENCAKLLNALAGLPGGYGLQRLARVVGGNTENVRKLLEALCNDGRLVKLRGRYILAEFSGGEK